MEGNCRRILHQSRTRDKKFEREIKVFFFLRGISEVTRRMSLFFCFTVLAMVLLTRHVAYY